MCGYSFEVQWLKSLPACSCDPLWLIALAVKKLASVEYIKEKNRTLYSTDLTSRFVSPLLIALQMETKTVLGRIWHKIWLSKFRFHFASETFV